MDWDWTKFSGKTIFRENPRVSYPSDSVGSSGSETQKTGEGILKSPSQESSAENRLSPSFHGSSKKARFLTGNQNQTCLVDGCESDLSNCKEYHRRHRVCDFHSKTPVVLVRSEEKRFCQQCSRFHSLCEFDEVKRSCRKRLDGHNRRRRKSQPESLFLNSRDFLSNCRGPILLQFSNPPIQVTDIGRSMWPNSAKSDEKALFPPNYSPFFSYGGDKQLPIQKNSTQLSFCQQLPESGTQLGSHKKLSSGILPPVGSGCALYLLSSHPAQAVPDASLNSLVQTDPTLLDSELHFETLSESPGSFGLKEKPVGKSILGDSILELEEPVGLLESEVPLKFPIYWE